VYTKAERRDTLVDMRKGEGGGGADGSAGNGSATAHGQVGQELGIGQAPAPPFLFPYPIGTSAEVFFGAAALASSANPVSGQEQLEAANMQHHHMAQQHSQQASQALIKTTITLPFLALQRQARKTFSVDRPSTLITTGPGARRTSTSASPFLLGPATVSGLVFGALAHVGVAGRAAIGWKRSSPDFSRSSSMRHFRRRAGLPQRARS